MASAVSYEDLVWTWKELGRAWSGLTRKKNWQGLGLKAGLGRGFGRALAGLCRAWQGLAALGRVWRLLAGGLLCSGGGRGVDGPRGPAQMGKNLDDPRVAPPLY